MIDLASFVQDLAEAIERVDARCPIAANARTGAPYQPGFGPHPETRAVRLLADELGSMPAYSEFGLGVPYGASARMTCDYCLGAPSDWAWAIEFKMLRLMGDNGKGNDNMLMHVLSPYPAHRSAVTDCVKLATAGLAKRAAVVIYAFEYADWPMEPAIEAFELLAARRVDLGPRYSSQFGNLVHPVHQRGAVFGWEVSAAAT